MATLLRRNEWCVAPSGQAFLSTTATSIRREVSLGKLTMFGDTDELITDRFLALLGVRELQALSCVSKACYVLVSANQDLWRELALSSSEEEWREIEKRIISARNRGYWKSFTTGIDHVPISTLGTYYSDYLFRPFQCANTSANDPSFSMQKYDAKYGKPENNVARISRSTTSIEEFVEKYEKRRWPAVIEGYRADFERSIERWKNGIEAGLNSLRAQKNHVMRVGPRDMNLDAFAAYSESNRDETPLYIFDAKFAERFPELAEDYAVPDLFAGPSRDLFEGLGPSLRPDYRWIIAGSARSGSKWHVDPNTTHAWNMSVKGRKRWLMLPPWSGPPPGVFPSKDGGSVAQPVSLIEWFLEFYANTRKTRGGDLIEFEADVGELVFVPSGWWHAVLNLDPDSTVAVTQNLVTPSNLSKALEFFATKPDQISGVRRTVDKLKFGPSFRATLDPKLLEDVEREQSALVGNSGGMKWQAVVHGHHEETLAANKRVRLAEASDDAQPVSGGSSGGFRFGFNVE